METGDVPRNEHVGNI